MNSKPNIDIMPDVANETLSKVFGTLEKAGMEKIELPITIENEGRVLQVPAQADVFVNLIDPRAKGIHMSRLYIKMQDKLEHNILTPVVLKELLEDFVDSHEGISDTAYLKVTYEHMCKRPSLKSDNTGWRSYPVTYSAVLEKGVFSLEVKTRVVYSSTCPCSAALARQLIQKEFLKQHEEQEDFNKEEIYEWLGKGSSIIATPHSQRSFAQLKVKLGHSTENFQILKLISLVEDALKTSVQSTVKREDEQEFARLNGSNPLFCEDSARLVRAALEDVSEYQDYYAKVQHFESLHPHDAVAVVTKGIKGGYQA